MGQLYTNTIKHEAKLDVVGLLADIYGGGMSSCLTGRIGESGIGFQKGGIYYDTNIKEGKKAFGTMKFATGFALGCISGSAQDVIGANFFRNW